MCIEAFAAKGGAHLPAETDARAHVAATAGSCEIATCLIARRSCARLKTAQLARLVGAFPITLALALAGGALTARVALSSTGGCAAAAMAAIKVADPGARRAGGMRASATTGVSANEGIAATGFARFVRKCVGAPPTVAASAGALMTATVGELTRCGAAGAGVLAGENGNVPAREAALGLPIAGVSSSAIAAFVDAGVATRRRAAAHLLTRRVLRFYCVAPDSHWVVAFGIGGFLRLKALERLSRVVVVETKVAGAGANMTARHFRVTGSLARFMCGASNPFGAFRSDSVAAGCLGRSKSAAMRKRLRSAVAGNSKDRFAGGA